MEENERAVASRTPPPNGDLHDPSNMEKGNINVSTNHGPQPFVLQGDKVPPAAEDVSDTNSGPRILLGEETYPEGGWEAWMVVFGAFCGLFASLGLMNSIATFQTYTAMHQLADYSEGTIGWIYSIYTFLSFFCGIYIGPIFDKYGPKWLLLPGGLGIVTCVMLTSICTSKWPSQVQSHSCPL
jgi:hypothetical protein